MKDWNIALGYYQELSTARAVVEHLKKKKFFRFAEIHCNNYGEVIVNRYFPASLFYVIFVAVAYLFFIALIKTFFLADISWFVVLMAAIPAALGALIYGCLSFSRAIDAEVVDHFKGRIICDEILVILQIKQSEVREVLEILRQVKSGHPVTFLLRPALFKETDLEVSLQPIALDQLKEEAVQLASTMESAEEQKTFQHPLMKVLKKSYRTIQALERDMADAEYIEQTVPSSAEWLLDNMYILEGSIEEVKRNLSKKYQEALPKIRNGALAGFPRIYALALDLVKNTAGMLTCENITVFLNGYQTKNPLTIGELWAFPLVLRLRLVEWIEFLAIRVDNRMREGELASFWGNRLLNAAHHDSSRLAGFLNELSEELPSLSWHFSEELLDHLFDEELVLPQIKKILEKQLTSPLSEVLHQEHINETSEQVLFSNSVRSLITLSQLSWADIFESVCPVDAVLRQDPIGTYKGMDAATRNSYREAVEEIARRACMSEVDVAKTALSLSLKGIKGYEKHIGYYLADAGRTMLELLVGYSPTLAMRARRWIVRHSTNVYLGGIALTTLFLEGALLYLLLKSEPSHLQIALFLIISLLPISEVSVQFINTLLTKILTTPLRPKMLFENGIPPEYKTLVVVPMMLVTPASIKEEIERLEIRYVANADPQLSFGLFSDFLDAPTQRVENDDLLLAAAIDGLKALEIKYGAGKFFLFHRERVWSNSENAWIGWERKRGKLEYLNRFLMGEQLPENIVYFGNAQALKGTRFVITLDADTQLPKDQARALIEVLAHPLNRPYLTANKKRLERGYTIIQPRVGTDFVHSKGSLFCQIFSEPTVVDPYSQAIFNVYQDLVGEGSYHGKGIYDAEAFHSILSHYFPEEHLLSHDLIEGSYVKVGFAGNICLFDMHPKDYFSWSNRQHRWIRGDWQIIDWLMATVPTRMGRKERNRHSWIDRWKILDNLRRALLPIALMVLLVLAWTAFSGAEEWTALALAVLFLPSITLILTKSGLMVHSLDAAKLFLKDLEASLLRSFITIALLPVEAFRSMDAMLRVAFRRLVSHQNLLQWTSSEIVCTSAAQAHRLFLLHLGWVSVFGAATLATVYYIEPQAAPAALPFCLLWFVSPLIVHIIDKPSDKPIAEEISEDDKKMLRKIARQTWRYFDEFVGPKTNWLPPDNYQTALNIEIAQRTSPTNIGLWLLAALSAHRFKYLTGDVLIDRIVSTLRQLKTLERHKGHFLNWYDIQSLEPLYPRYVSTVDSGNLIACFWTLKQGIEEIITSPIIPSEPLAGIKDTYELQEGSDRIFAIDDAFAKMNEGGQDLAALVSTVTEISRLIQEHSSATSDLYWLKHIEEQLNEWGSIISRYFGWAGILIGLPAEQLSIIDPQAQQWKKEILSWIPSLEELANKKPFAPFEKLLQAAQNDQMPDEIISWGKKLQEALSTSQWLAGEKIALAEEISAEAERFSQEIDLKFLYNDERKLFAVGYNADDKRLDASYYDLLASEARIASLVAIAKEDVPLEHWWALGRPYGIAQGRKALLSWGGTMFEYLMPLIFNKQFSGSLLGEACEAAVACQIAYGKKRGIPWGISESAFSAIDAHKTYQYKSFGVPGLGLKRGLEDDLVVSPYSSALALAVDAPSAIKNLKRISEKKRINLIGAYGYYDSIDFTRQRSPTGERGVVVYVYMAHHQGMVLSSINNALNNDSLIKLFHKDARVCGVNSLLYEQIPLSSALKVQSVRKESTLRRLEPFSSSPIMGVVETPESMTPKINLLSNENYSLMISNSGGGYSRWRDLDIYRWRADTTRDPWGNFCYLKDVTSGEVWSSTYHPTQTVGKEYSVNFKADKAEFRRKDHQIEAFTEIVVSPEDNAEIRLVTLINHASETREIELTSYLELSLAPHATDRTHPCFNKLFIETEALYEDSALLAFRRLRSAKDLPVWAVHVVSASKAVSGDLQYETDRSRFIGRGNSLKAPAALKGDLSNTSGTVLDPIFSLRRKVVIGSGERIQLSFVTAVADNKLSALGLVEKYKDIAASHRAMELAWAYAQLELRHLRVHQEEVQLFQKLASRLIYPHVQLRSVEDRLKKNRLGQSGLWSQGISGDYPIVVVTVGDIYDIDLVKQLLVAHAFWTLRGLKVDLVILNEEAAGYMQPLQEQLQNLIQSYSNRQLINNPGGVFLRGSAYIPPEEVNLILSVAQAVLIAARGSLRQQLISPRHRVQYPPKLNVNHAIKEEPSQPLEFLELAYFNGLGGYTPDGRSYAIYLGPQTNTPAPWINVLANPQFGAMVSEAGMGCVWYGNSQTNRLTPWSNDPVTDPITDTIYIRDEELGTVWTPTPAPIRELDAYRVTHGQGYTRYEHNSHGINQELIVFVPVDDEGGLPLRIQRLRLANRSQRRRRLTLTAYTELVLGDDKENTQTHLSTEWDLESQSLFAYNYYHQDFNGYVAFAFSTEAISSYTGDRTEFIGRNRSTSSPEALGRKALSRHVGVALDPCFALQTTLEIGPEEVREVVFVLGYAPDAVAARELISRCRDAGKIDQLLTSTQQWWNRTLETIQVDIPDKAGAFLINRWLIYQSLSCRFWGRSGFYQSSGAYGYRDQLQDSMALVYSHPAFTRDYILKAASRQFVEGDVQHWWHPQTGAGVRTRCSDDLLWLPFVTAHYIRVTGDRTILNEIVPFLESDKLAENQEELFQIPSISKESGTLLEHCRRAVTKGNTAGPHGLPLIGSCDWNDGMNLVGIDGKGESVWLAWFLIHVMNDFSDLLDFSGAPSATGEGFKTEARRIAKIVEETAWDGLWYRRAYFDDGTPLGSKEGTEDIIDSLPQSWAVIAGLADPARCEAALTSAVEYLVKPENNLVLLLTPPFDKILPDPGYIKGYPPGVRENGGQYTHGSSWLAMAYARSGNGNKAVELLQMLSPTAHTRTPEASALYRIEPYSIAADVYDLRGQVGRGGWTWYTGAASWLYRIWLEEVLGFKLRGQTLSFACCIPKEWDGFKLAYRYLSSTYDIAVTNPHHVSRGYPSITLDGTALPSNEIVLQDDKSHHVINIVLNPEM